MFFLIFVVGEYVWVEYGCDRLGEIDCGENIDFYLIFFNRRVFLGLFSIVRSLFIRVLIFEFF